uniref:Ig-like domain-containing protein n=1 Tax=Taeniopygia guttata TaxID=59729 RepID=A0A674HDW0_TAEGU
SVCFPKPEPPYFVTHLEPLEVSVGSYTTLQCHVAGTPEITVSWYKGDTKLRSTPEYKVFFKDNVATLIFNKVARDSGQYTCQASNEAGKDFCSAQLSVKEPPKFIKKPEALRFVKQGDTVQLECKISGTPEIRIMWYKNDQALQASDRLHMSFVDSMAMLTILGATAEDAGDYICEAHNSAGTLTAPYSTRIPGCQACSQPHCCYSSWRLLGQCLSSCSCI